LFCWIGQYAIAQDCDVMGVFHSDFQEITELLNENNCNSCHADAKDMGGWNYDTYASFLESGNCGETMILNGDASSSFFYRKLNELNSCGETEGFEHRIADQALRAIENWINFGAPEHCVLLYEDIRLILDDNGCDKCHTTNAQAWRYDMYTAMIENGFDENCGESRVIVKGSSDMSLLYDKINNDGFVACGDPMLADSGPMSKADVGAIRDWINSGANETSSTLPVILNNFQAIELQGKSTLFWSTEVEVATDKFIVERSATGRDFQTIQEVAPLGGSSLGADYQVVDEDALIGENYYRLKILDIDGSFTYSNIRLVRIRNGETIVTIYPNPAVGQERLTLKWLPQSDLETTYLNIVDLHGRNLHRKIIFEGTNYVRLPDLLDGVYYIIVENSFDDFLLERVIIIN